MILLQTNQISKSFATDLILSNISIEVQSGERVALVGRNGAGKSTLLKIIAGAMSADSGDIIIPKDKTMGYLPQNATLNSNKSIYDELLTVFQPLLTMEKKLRKMEEDMASPDLIENQTEYNQLLKSYDQLQVSFKDQGGYSYQSDIQSVLTGLNFQSYRQDTPISSLSGGQKTRLALGKLLLIQPDILILDEPTNHLDIETLQWLENYLQRYKGSILIVSHDRYFLDKVVTKVYEISHHKAIKYTGNYSRYLVLKEAEYERELKNYEKQQKEVAKLNDFIQKNIVRASTTKRAQSRRKQLEKMDLMEHPQGDLKSARFSFQTKTQSGHDVLSVSDLKIGYQANNPLMSNLNFMITRGESVALVGPNGIGKSTLLKAIVGTQTRLSGHVTLGSQVSIGYYDQEQAKLTSNKDVLHELWDEYPLTPEKDIRTVLGNFLFSGDDVLKLVSQLSGGEKARLALAKLMMKKDNLLVLDEPTNHLDIDSKEVLETALINYPGTILFVSHDRFFINNIATRVLELSKEDGITNYLGDYDYYLEKKEEMQAISLLEENEHVRDTKPSKEDSNQTDGKAQFLKDKERKKKERQLERKIEQLEETIQDLEIRIEENEAALLTPEVFNDTKRAKEIHESTVQDKDKLEKYIHEWEQVQQEYDNLSSE
ncbi:ABC-F family ATP-binding cassette domain-containing protein [Terrilactibacillus laevilacticus]|uniref:ABC-F family ATP-binding cassette domain-containing protein n=1 Tax=Terrilactibacillus laevilacticus TaxID=1380157 RepID=A0ABW5PSA1_9BACI|nr:ABC-F family ATP-binding cassette domain-containing protein [Terrilactibacillus laevilacticus]